MLYFGAIVLLPQLLQEVYGYTATWAGLASAPVGIIPVILSPIIGRFAHKLDMRRLVTFSFIMYAVCFTGAHGRSNRVWISALPHGRSLFRDLPSPASLCR